MQTVERESIVKHELEGVSLEHRLLLLLARLDLNADHVSQIRDLLKNDAIDWTEFVHNASWQRLGGLAYHHLRSNKLLDEIPANVQSNLKSAYVENTVKNVYLRSELRKVLRELREDGIPVIVLKGAALLDQIYGNVSIRSMSDLDLLVPEELADRAQALVINLGYSPSGSADAQKRTRDEHRHLPTLVDSDGIAAVEIHSHIVTRSSPLRFSLSGFWARARCTTLVGEEVLTLAPEDMLIHLAIHFFLDRRFRSYAALGQICDMAEVVRAYENEINWDNLLRRVLENKGRGPVYCGLSLAKDMLDAPVPDEVLTALRPLEYSQDSAMRFTRRRVLDTRPVLVSDLIAPVAVYSLTTLIKNLVTRLFPSRTYMSENYRDDSSARMYGSYFHRLKEASAVLGLYLKNPVELWQQFQIDRWIHSMQNESSSEPRSES